MVVLIVTSSMRRPPLNCSISGLEDLASVMTEKEYLRLAETLSLTSEPFPGNDHLVEYLNWKTIMVCA